MALYNLVRYGQDDSSGCTLVVDIGARSTNLVFVENRKAFSRSIPVAGHTITQELMKEFSLAFKEAEELKLAHAVVAFSGAVETSESQIVSRVAKDRSQRHDEAALRDQPFNQFLSQSAERREAAREFCCAAAVP